MALEIERKFLVRESPLARLENEVGERLRQGYVAIDHEVEVRIRIGAESAVVTIKAGRGQTRSEVEMPVGSIDAEELWGHTKGRRIEKTRYRVHLARGGRDAPDHVAEVDVYHGDLAGLHVAEVEFESPSAAAAFTPPDWFGTELTGDERWSNANLARHGAPEEFIDETR
jgi:adenylate cyclase